MPFGKYKGREVHTLNSPYLKWLLANSDLSEPLKTAVEFGIDRLPYTPKPPRDIEQEAEYIVGYIDDRGQYIPPFKPTVRTPFLG